MILAIYVNTDGTHSWMGFFHDRDWDNPKYREEVDRAAKKTFQNLKLKKIQPITITEVRDVEPRTGQMKQASTKTGNALQRGRTLGKREELIRTVADAYKPRD